MVMVSSKPLNPSAESWIPLPVHLYLPLSPQIYNKPLPQPADHWVLHPQYMPCYFNMLAGCSGTDIYDIRLQPQRNPFVAQEACPPCTTTDTCGGGATVGKSMEEKKRLPRGPPCLSYGGRVGRNGRFVWMPKSSKFDEADGACVRSAPRHRPPPPSLPTPEDDVPLSGRTTVMIRNIPNQYRRNMLLGFLDILCQEQNEKAKLESDESLRFEYDFVYLPMDFWRGDNLGYAFVNFTTATAATKIRGLLHNYKWGCFEDSFGVVRESKKTCEVTWARIQGKEELVNNFRNSNFVCSNTDYLPVVLSPPRDGTASFASPTTIGRCLGYGTRRKSLKN